MAGLSESFPRTCRLRKKSDFQEVFDHPTRFSGGAFTFLVRRNQFGHARLGVVASKKNAGISVQRNRVKRLIRESFRCRADSLDCLDIVVIAKRGCSMNSNVSLSKALSRQWKKLARCKLS